MARVLVVEDEESWSDPLSYMLRREGFEVTVAATGPQALTEFERSGADLVLLDLMLPQMSGVEVCRELRARGDVPIIMVRLRRPSVGRRSLSTVVRAVVLLRRGGRGWSAAVDLGRRPARVGRGLGDYRSGKSR